MRKKLKMLAVLIFTVIYISTFQFSPIHAETGSDSDFFKDISGKDETQETTGTQEQKETNGNTSTSGDTQQNTGNTGNIPVIDDNYVDNEPLRFALKTEPHYDTALENWYSEGYNDYKGEEIVVRPAEMAAADMPEHAAGAEESYGYGRAVLKLDGALKEYKVGFSAPEEGLYALKLDYYAEAGSPNAIEFGFKINGEYQYLEMKKIVLDKIWLSGNSEKEGMLLSPDQELDWKTAWIRDGAWLISGVLKVHLKKGQNEITLLHLRESILLGDIAFCSPPVTPDYEQYQKEHSGELYEGEPLVIEAENVFSTNNISVLPGNDMDPGVVPQKAGENLLNILGGKTWKLGGYSAKWKLQAPRAGFYNLTVKYFNNYKTNMPVFRSVSINGRVPFDALEAYPFQYSGSWQNVTLSDQEGTPYRIWLEEGENTLELTATAAPYRPAIQRMEELTRKISNLYIEIKMATGNSKDKNRDWDITGQVANLLNRLNYYARELNTIYADLTEITGKKPDAVRNLLVSAEQIKNLIREPEKIPVRFEILSEESGSVLQMMGKMLEELPQQKLKLDRIYFHGEGKLPAAQAGLFKKISYSIASLFTSFFQDYTEVSGNDGEDHSINVWVTRARQFVSVTDQLTASEFTAKTGIRVRFSLLPDESKLTLAVASGQAPDAALGIASYIPYNLAVRNALYNLKNFDNYNEVIDRFSPGGVLPYIWNKGCYALPESQFFYVMIYRTDILNGLGIKPPQTWDDVCDMLPKLQRNGMNFYMPMSSGSGFKYFNVTLPFIYQYGGKLFSEDGTKTAIDSDEGLEGMKLMTRLYTIYSIPLQVQSFYNKFRSGEIPIGITDFATYLQLLTAAPEIAGSWEMSVIPGIKRKDGTIARWAPGSGESMIIFNNSEMKKESWEFFDWWMSAETQLKYGNLMFSLYDKDYGINSANLEAFAGQPWQEEHKKVILEQWKWLKDVAHMPGDYMLEREISNAWNRIVFDGVNERRAIDEAVLNTNREIVRKLEEFGFMKDGKLIKKIDVPDLDDIRK